MTEHNVTDVEVWTRLGLLLLAFIVTLVPWWLGLLWLLGVI